MLWACGAQDPAHWAGWVDSGEGLRLQRGALAGNARQSALVAAVAPPGYLDQRRTQNTQFASAQVAAGRAAMAAGKTKEAQQLFSVGLRAFSAHVGCRCGLAGAQLAQGELLEAHKQATIARFLSETFSRLHALPAELRHPRGLPGQPADEMIDHQVELPSCTKAEWTWAQQLLAETRAAMVSSGVLLGDLDSVQQRLLQSTADAWQQELPAGTRCATQAALASLLPEAGHSSAHSRKRSRGSSFGDSMLDDATASDDTRDRNKPRVLALRGRSSGSASRPSSEPSSVAPLRVRHSSRESRRGASTRDRSGPLRSAERRRRHRRRSRSRSSSMISGRSVPSRPGTSASASPSAVPTAAAPVANLAAALKRHLQANSRR